MPLQLLSRSTTDTTRSRSPSPLTTPTPKSQIPTICLTTATPCESHSRNEPSQPAPRITSETSRVSIAPKPLKGGEASRKRLVPKKSKLSLLGSSARARERDFSDVVRRVGGTSANNGGSGFEIYVDPTNDPDIGEILMVKKKKSRMALDGMQWGTLGEVTNVPSISQPSEKGDKKLKAKVDENQKWWSIARGRRDSKEKDKGKDKHRTKSPEPVDQPADVHARFNSLDSGTLLAHPTCAEHSKSAVEHLSIPVPPSATLAPGTNNGKGSVALRAMRSVRSLARIGSWAQLKNIPNPDSVTTAAAPVTDKEPDGKKKKKKKEKEKQKEKDSETIRYSGSSFEAGALSASPVDSKHKLKSLGKKASILGLGLPSTMRLPSTRTGSTASSIITADAANRRSSADSVNLLGSGILARARHGSTMSTVSSLRPMSTKSRESSGSSGATSVKWDEVGLRTVKEVCRKDKEDRSRAREIEIEGKEKKKSRKFKSAKSEKETARKLSDNRRTPLGAIFPGALSERKGNEAEQPPLTPVLRIEATAEDGHEDHEARVRSSPVETPAKRVHPRPVSEHPFCESRPKAIYEADDDNAVISMLDAATNDLAQLINRLDLEATPGNVKVSPMSHRSPFLLEPSPNSSSQRLVPADSSLKGLRSKNKSSASLRPYAQSCSRSTGVHLGQNIAPWSALNASISPSKPSPSTIRLKAQDNMATVRSHKRMLTPAPAAELSPIFKALRPATARLPISKTVIGTSSGISPSVISMNDRSPSTLTFGSGHSKSESRSSFTTSPVFKKAQGSSRKRSALALQATLGDDSLPISPEVRRNLGLAGTMGYSVGSIAEQDHDGSDPDSDIPDELQVILSNSDQEADDTLSFKREPAHPPPSPGLPPDMPLPMLDTLSRKSSLAEVPVFRATVIDGDHQVDIEEAGTLSEDDTKKSFDFTGELQKLNESGASDRHSFIEQLENAFRTPAKVDLRYDFSDTPPIPTLNTLQVELSRVGESSFDLPIDYESRELSRRGIPIDVNVEPSLLPGSDSFATTASDEELLDIMVPHISRDHTAVVTQKSNGQLNRDFKFGGKPSSSSKKDASSLTLSDIIPPPEIARSISMTSLADNESSLMKSILANAINIEFPPEGSRPQADSDSGAKRETLDSARNSYLSTGRRRNPSGLSFTGFDSFAEVRRGFEFSDGRPGFYLPPGTKSDRRHRKHESMYSIASVSSYGNVLHGGSADPFDYGSILPLPSLRERPSSDDFSFTMSTTVDDTFAFLRRQPHRRRVDSDASSFYFRSSLVHPYSRSSRRPDSGMSVGPPISLFNRNSTYRHRRDSNTSISSIAQSYANCRRFSWSRHRRNISVESLLSDISTTNIGRPDLGDKMLDSALERTAPLTSISASPGPSLSGSIPEERVYEYDKRMSYDSVMDAHYKSQKTDSLFEKTGNRSSICSTDSTFFEQNTGNAAKLPRYRPISSLSIPSVHSPPKEDDTMINMLGGGQVRRRSVTSMIGSSPCIQLEAERRKNIFANPPETVFSRIKNAHLGDQESPKLLRVIETKPSIASTTNSVQFGDERMIRARHGLLERQSLENTVLVGDGEDLSASFRMPVFTRPGPANRSRSSTYTSTSGADTPPLSISDGYSSFSEGSLSSIDLSQLNALLSSTSHASPSASFERARPYGRSHGHRRRISQARASRTSIYETIQEEFTSTLPPTSSPAPADLVPGSASNTPVPTKPMDPLQVCVVDPETSSVDSFSLWDDERGITALRRYYALRDEAENTVTESKRTWLDTPLSVFALQSFDPPHHRIGMQAMLEHSLQNYGPLPSELRLRRARSRVNSRPSPYPRTVKTSFTSSPSTEHLRAAVTASLVTSIDDDAPRPLPSLSKPLQQITINPNVPVTMSADAKERVVSRDKPERVVGLPPRPHLGSVARRTTSGRMKKSTGRTSTENKENSTSIRAPPSVNISQGTIATPADGLRLNRPRPKGRPTQASVRPFRV